MTNSHDVVIVGAGPVGAAAARELSRVGRRVLLIDPGSKPGEAWRASAGMLAPQIETREDTPLFELGVAGREYYRDRAAELADETGINIGLVESGILRLAVTEADDSLLRSAVAWQRQHGQRADWLDPDEVRNEFPWVGRNRGALWAPQDGAVDPVRLVEALRASAIRSGTRFVTDTITSLVRQGGRITGVESEHASYAAGEVVLAAGAWTGRLSGLPRPVSVEPVRGQMIAKPWPKHIPPAIVYGAHGYVLERAGEALCGATVEHAGFTVETTASGEQQVAGIADELIPVLGSAPVTRRWAGLRPGTPDGLPIFGAEPEAPNLWYATGYGRNGILFAGITGIALTHLMAREATFDGVRALSPGRFWSW